MKRKKALELQQAWTGGECDHPAFAKEYDKGARTGSHICTRCGAIFTAPEKARITGARRDAADAMTGDDASRPPSDSN